MTAEDKAKVILKIICPLLIIVSPIFLYVIWKVPNPDGPEKVSIFLIIVMNLIGIVTWISSIGYGLFQLGWIKFFKK